MIRFLQKVHSNTATIEKIKNKKCAEQEGFEKSKKLQKLLGQDGKKNAATDWLVVLPKCYPTSSVTQPATVRLVVLPKAKINKMPSY